ncbi:MAG: RagB/SusD family nutrient uptake outer membrane protein [Candidatus Pedobacter colombiensis]|uniref:RagB/SusD family nutrient uptake outer membrane protein n=1 Tax=Candidatus Pedobacter colombiensis TaxID=3121371 RepID=A0AAJ5WB12_9SPHI|nr:RagB/SusD family nutrient uptake outer membrane protein [Pedobacter sp.]WEK21035.1 MAG: RagB/SusD family nutrient uptake outer membrane protein [Pedobacter sp.]
MNRFNTKYITFGPLKKLALACTCILWMSACNKLDLTPTNGLTADKVYATPLGYKQALAKVYGAFALTGNATTGAQDIPVEIIKDEGNSDFLRLYWNLQELTTDEAAWSWQSDAGIQGLHELSWSSINSIINGLYYRSYFQITLCNDFIRQSADAEVSKRGISGADADNIRKYRAESRFLRAYQYWVLMDLYGNPPLVTEDIVIGGKDFPKQIQRKDLFVYIESELKAIEGDLAAPKTNEYARVDRAAVWALLSRMYLNAEIYTGTAKYTEAITYCNKITDAGYTLHNNYRELTIADNHLNTDEFILTIAYDGTNTQNYGGTTYLMHGPAHVPADVSGSNGDWGGLRFTQNFVNLFADKTGNTDSRAQFYMTGQSLEMTDLYVSTDGYSSTKFRNKTRSGGPAPHQDAAKDFSDIDFPLFRLGEIYLTYAEAVLRGGSGGTLNTALDYMNKLRTRAYKGSTAGNISSTALTKDFILDERGRELYYEAFRRTDLIRFGKFTTNAYLWAWKGGVKNGTSVADKFNLFPLPPTDLAANPNLIQNTGY